VALNRPKNLFAYPWKTPPLAQMAARYAKGVVANHFVDGNKRTAFMNSVTFLRLNGHQLIAPKEESVLKFWALAAGEISEEQLADWFARNTHS
jgi:death on curing protein